MGRARRIYLACCMATLVSLVCCTSEPTPEPPPPCDQLCLDGIAVAGMRLTLKQIFNQTVQGKPVGPQDFRYACPLGGTAHVFGTAVANAIQGATEVNLTYELEGCVLLDRDTEPKENYHLASTGKVTQVGTIAVQPTATTSLGMQSEAITVTGTVYDPPVPYELKACKLLTVQDGSKVTGTVCGRDFSTFL
jgi:hypothetical protein